MNFMRNVRFKILFSLLLLSFASFAQTTKTLTLDEAIKLGLGNSKQLKVAGTRLDIAKAKTAQYLNALIPNVTLNSGYSHLSNNVTPFAFRTPAGEFVVPQVINQFTNRLSANEVVFAGFRPKNLYESSQFLEKAAVLDIDKDKIEIKNNIVAAFYNFYKLLASNDILIENGNTLSGRLKDIKNFVKQGTALENDQLKAELAVAQLELSQKEVRNALEVANFNMAILLGLPTETKFELDKNTLFSEKTVGDLNGYFTGVSSRPDLVASDLRIQAASKSVEIVKGGLYPVISVGANAYLNNPNQRVFPTTAYFKGTWDAGVSLSYNLTNLYTGKFQIQEAEANVTQANLLKNQLSDGAKMEINTNYFAYQSALEKIKLMGKAIIQTTENQRVTKNRFNSQVAMIGELLEADSLVLQSKINLEVAKADAELAYYKLLKAVGK
jgi:outer membrane protein